MLCGVSRLGNPVDHRVVYILWRSGSVPVLSLGRLWTQLTQAGVLESRDLGGRVPEHRRGIELDTSKIKI